MSYPVQEYHPLVIDTSFMHDYIDEHGTITELDTFEEAFGFSLYDFCVAVLSGNYIDVCKSVGYGSGTNPLDSNVILKYDGDNDKSYLIVFRGDLNEWSYGGISIMFDTQSDDNNVVDLTNYLIDNLISILPFEV